MSIIFKRHRRLQLSATRATLWLIEKIIRRACQKFAEAGYRLKNMYLKYLFKIFSGDNARAISPDGFSECGYTQATSDTCTSFTWGRLVSERKRPKIKI